MCHTIDMVPVCAARKSRDRTLDFCLHMCTRMLCSITFIPDSTDKPTAHFLNKRLVISHNSHCQVFCEQCDSRCDKETLSLICLWEAWVVGLGVGHRSFDYRVVISELFSVSWVSSSIMHFEFAQFITCSADISPEF